MEQGGQMASPSDVKMASPYQHILDACASCWSGSFIAGTINSDNCSGFVKAVAIKLGVPIPDKNADGIVDYLDNNDDWARDYSGSDAARFAAAGQFIIAGLKSDEHTPPRSQGHVAIVVPGPLYRNIYPLVWCGSTGSAQSKGTLSVGQVWNTKDRDNVAYYAF
jgi:hypothetical protein